MGIENWNHCELSANRSRPSELFASELITSLLSAPSCFPDRCASCNNVINSCFHAAGNLQRDGSHSGEENRSKPRLRITKKDDNSAASNIYRKHLSNTTRP